MTFLNKKEEVLDIELTQYGKYLLSKGQLTPVYYAFYDDDILYDSQYAGFTEKQNETEDRIKETPRTAVQYLFGSTEVSVFTNSQGKNPPLIPGTYSGDEAPSNVKVQSKPDKLLSPQLPLGTSDTNNQYIPAWNINFLHGELLWASTVLSSSAYIPVKKRVPIQPIPQLNTEINYKKWILAEGVGKNELEKFSKHDYISDKFSDDSILVVEKDFLILQIEEDNGLYEKENFDIEIFEVFDVKKDSDGNVISTDEQSLLFLQDIGSEPQPWKHVEYYFDIFSDLEIDPELICDLLKEPKIKNIFVDDDFNCAEISEKKSKNIYIDTNELKETCD